MPFHQCQLKMGHLSGSSTTSCCNSVWPVWFKSRFYLCTSEEQPHWTWRDLSSSQTLFIWWIHLLERFERFRMVASRGIIIIITSCLPCHGLSFSLFFANRIFHCPPVCLCMSVCAQESKNSSGCRWFLCRYGSVCLLFPELSQGQFGQPMALTPLKQAVTTNPSPSRVIPDNPGLIPSWFRGTPSWVSHTEPCQVTADTAGCPDILWSNHTAAWRKFAKQEGKKNLWNSSAVLS